MPARSSTLVVANLTADVHHPASLPEFPTCHANPGAILILSGILREQEQEVRAAFDTFHPLESRPENEWVTLVYQR
jgi:ribosomal protein L11 methylase PrmA